MQAQRAYADGGAATFRLPNPVSLINWLRGADWQAAVDDLRTLAGETELGALETFAAPGWLEQATRLAPSRKKEPQHGSKVTVTYGHLRRW